MSDIFDAVAASMIVLLEDDFLAVGRIPRSDEQVPRLTLDEAIARVGRREDLFVLFVSHRWLRPHADAAVAHPDTPDGIKYDLLRAALLKLRVALPASIRIALWLDFFSIDQFDPTLRQQGIRSLPAYFAQCDGCLTPLTDAHYTPSERAYLEQQGLDAPEFLDGAQVDGEQSDELAGLLNARDTFSRAWVRLEQFLCTNGLPKDGFPWFETCVPFTWRRDRPHFVITPKRVGNRASLITLPRLSRSILQNYSPRDGRLQREDDRPAIEAIMKACRFDETHADAYQGQVDAEGRPHGLGSIVFRDGETYTGEWVHGRREGQGVTKYSDGAVYEGGYLHDLRHGTGNLRWASGHRYEGGFYNGLQAGLGAFYFQDGNCYRGDFRGNRRHGVGVWTFQVPTASIGSWNLEQPLSRGDRVECGCDRDEPRGTYVHFPVEGPPVVGYRPHGDPTAFRNLVAEVMAPLAGTYEWKGDAVPTRASIVAPHEVDGISPWTADHVWSRTERAVSVQADATAFLRALPDASIDVFCTDPPYNLGLTTSWDDFAFEAYIAQVRTWSKEMVRALSPEGSGFVFMNVRFASDWIRALEQPLDDGRQVRCEYLVHAKTNSDLQSQLLEDATLANRNDPPSAKFKKRTRSFRESTDVLIFFRHSDAPEPDHFAEEVRHARPNQRWPPSWPEDANIVVFPKPPNDDRLRIPGTDQYHFAQKPLDLVRLCCRARRGTKAIVCDPFVGSGTTALAAVLEGKFVLTCEGEADYAEMTATRAHKEGLVCFLLERARLFGGDVCSYHQLMSESIEALHRRCAVPTDLGDQGAGTGRYPAG